MKKIVIGIITAGMFFVSFSCSENKVDFDDLQFKSVDNFKKLLSYVQSDDFAKKNSKSFFDDRNNYAITQEMVDDIQNQTGIVIDLSLAEINQIYIAVFNEMTNNVNVVDYVQNEVSFSINFKDGFSYIVNGDQSVDIRNFSNYNNLSFSEKEKLQLSNYLFVEGYGNRGACDINGLPFPCWIAGGLTGAAIGAAFGGTGAIVGAVLGTANRWNYW
jgi:hypothetical protein